MKKITEEQLWEYVIDKEGAEFTANIRQADVDELAKYDMDASDFLNIHISRSGTWDDNSWGSEWNGGPEYYQVEDYDEVVAEVIIPEHTVTKQRYAAFTPEFDE